MILQRLGARLRQQDWTAVTIELVLVMAGVFLGIQMSNWNERRKERATEAAYLARIAQDARRDVAQLDEIIRVAAVRKALLNHILPKASGQPLPDEFESARGRVAIERVPPYDSQSRFSPGFSLFILTPLDDNRSAYETMINTGAIAGMTDMAALRKIQDYYAAVDREQHFELNLEQNRDKFVDAQLKAGISPVKAMTVDQLTEAFAANPELLATAQNYWLYTNRHLKLTRELQVQARQLAESLEQGR
jgi:cbb3-type cytochrome oxidase subunit 3